MNQFTGRQQVRETIRQLLVAQGARFNGKQEESLLIRDGAFCGHRISLDGYRAVWFVEEDQVKLFDPAGHLLMSTQPSLASQTRAA